MSSDDGGGSSSSSAERAVAGAVAIDVARELADPVRALRDRLGLVVDTVERHLATSTGPTHYPWRSLQALRQELATSYLEATHLAQQIDELDRALAPAAVGWLDAGAAAELGVRLAGAAAVLGLELLVDLGEAPLARGIAGTVALIVAQMVGACARSARAMAGSSLSVRVGADAGWVAIAVVDNGAGSVDADAIGATARDAIAAWGAQVDATSEPGRGCAFELRLVAAA